MFVKPVTAGGWSDFVTFTNFETAKLTASDAEGGDYFGDSVAISGDTALIAATGNDDGGTDSGSAYVFTYDGSVWSQQKKLTAVINQADRYFGGSVAIDGDTALIGAYGDSVNGTNSGAAFVFRRSGATWNQLAKLTASDGAASDFFGSRAVALSGDTALVGAYGDDDSGTASGSAYIFVKPVSGWATATETAKLTASDGAASDEFGLSVSVSLDTALVGAPNDDSAAGSTYVFISQLVAGQLVLKQPSSPPHQRG